MQLKLALIATFVTLAIAAPQEEQPALKVRGPAPLPEAAAEITPREADDSILEKRACNYNKGCRSSQGIKAGKYCGYCYEVWGSLKSTNLYQLNGKTGKEGCCDYGHSKACEKAYNSGQFHKHCPM